MNEFLPPAEIEAAERLAELKKRWLGMVRDLADTMEKVLPDPVEIVAGLICEQSKLCIGGSSKTYKTWFTQDMALSISTGTDFLGRKCLQRRVLYVNLELKESTFERRLQTITHHKRIQYDRKNFHHMSLRGQLGGMRSWQVVDMIIDVAKALEAQVCLLDPIYKLNVDGDENSSRDQTVFFNHIDRITTDAGCTVIFADHFGKGNQSEKDPLDAIRGSSAKGGDLDAAIILRKHQQDGSLSVDVVHRELPPVEPFCLTWRYPIFHTDEDLDPADMKKPTGGRPKSHDPVDLLGAIHDRTDGNPISIVAWAELAGVPRKTLAGYLPSMRSKGWIQTVGDGNDSRQAITKKGQDALAKS